MNTNYLLPLERTRMFLRAHCGDALSMDEIQEDLKQLARSHPHTIRNYLANLEAVLNSNLPGGVLANVVAIDANRALDDPSDAGARAWLRELAQIMHNIL